MGDPPRGLDRVLIGELDSLAQAETFSTRPTAAAVQDITTRLRVGSLVANHVVITDAMLLDGAYFLTLGPAGVAAALGRGAGPLPLIVSSPHGSLEEALGARRRNRGFRWAIDGSKLGRQPGSRRWPPLTESVWAEWVSAHQRGLIGFEEQRGVEARMAFTPAPEVSKPGRALVRELLRERARSRALTLIDEAKIPDAEKDAVRLWWSNAYVGLLAQSARADWINFHDDAEAPAGFSRIPLPEALLDWARAAGPATFSLGWDASPRQRDRLAAHPTWSRMRDLAFVATSVARPASRRRVLVGALASAVLAAAAIVFALPFWEDTDLALPIAWGAFAIVLATTFPVRALQSLAGLLRREKQASLTVRAGGARA